MAQGKKISELTELSSVTDNDEFLFVDKEGSGANSGQGGSNVKIKFSDLKMAITDGMKGEPGMDAEKGQKGEVGDRGIDGGGAAYFDQSPSDGDSIFYMGSGNLGLGTDAPTYKLTVKGSVALVADDSNQVVSINNSKIQSQTPGVRYENLLLNPSGGNVGIGTANPLEMLHIEGRSMGRVTADSSAMTLAQHRLTSNAEKFGDGVNLGGFQGSLNLWGSNDDGGDGRSNKAGALKDEFVSLDFTTAYANGTSSSSGYTCGRMGVIFEGLHHFENGETSQNRGTTLAFANSNSDGKVKEQMRITSAGNVGIGTDSPNQTLHIKKTGSTVAHIESVSDAAMVNVNSAFDYDSAVNFYENGANKWTIGNDASEDLFRIRDGSGTAAEPNVMVLKNNGNVGIGITNPNAKLHLNLGMQGTTNTASGLLIEATSGSVNSATLDVSVRNTTDGNQFASLDVYDSEQSIGDPKSLVFQPSGGNVGIGAGAINPVSKLDVSGQAYFHDNVEGRAPLYVKQDGTGPSAYFMGGNVGIGTFSPFADLDSSGGLHIAGNTPRLRLQDDNPTSDGVWDVMNNNSVFTIQHRNAEGTAIANYFHIKDDGNVGIGTADPVEKLDVQGNINLNGGMIKANYAISNDSGLAKALGHSLYHIMISSNYNSGDAVRSAAWYVTLNNEATSIEDVSQVHVHNNQTAEFYISDGILRVRGLSSGNNRAIVMAS